MDEDHIRFAIGVVTSCDLVEPAQGSSFRKATSFSIVEEHQFYTPPAMRSDNSQVRDSTENVGDSFGRNAVCGKAFFRPLKRAHKIAWAEKPPSKRWGLGFLRRLRRRTSVTAMSNSLLSPGNRLTSASNSLTASSRILTRSSRILTASSGMLTRSSRVLMASSGILTASSRILTRSSRIPTASSRIPSASSRIPISTS